ncbi:MAG: cytochrome c oxidase subunit II [bacterium]|nr:cytochrome c oxidase subunit II [bacterium]
MEEKVYGYWLPMNVSAHAEEIDQLINWLHVFMVLLFVGWGVFFIYCLFKYRAGANPNATHADVKAKSAKYVEIAVCVVEAILLIGVSMPVWSEFKSDFPDESDSVRVQVLAEQFAWNIQYPGKDGKFGRRASEYISTDNLLGLDPNDENGKDDFNSINQLHIPVNKPVIITLMSKDVIHSFKIPVMRLTQDIIPGQSIRIWMEAAKIGPGHFDIACAQLCGLGHYRMRGQLTIETADAYQKWLDEQESGEEDEFSF